VGAPPDKAAFAWTLPQRRVLLLLLGVLLVFLSVRYAFNPVFVSDPQPDRPARFDDLADRIDPNTASWADLAALPGLGEKRAKDIVAFREESRRYAPSGVVFARPEDMLKVKGIGLAMLESVRPHLAFPEAVNPPRSAPTSRP
jgi:competence ComEA-like helix-hairpin-helix protein